MLLLSLPSSSSDPGHAFTPLNPAAALPLALALALLGRTIGAVNLAPPDVGEGNLGLGLNESDVLGVALGGVARASRAGVQPLHETALVPPDAHGQDHTSGEGLAHAGGGAEVHVSPGAGGLAELVVEHIGLGQAGKIDRVSLDDLPVLLVDALDGGELSILAGGELSDDGEGAAGVDLEGRAVAVGVGNVDAVRVPRAAVLVADALEGALLTRALVERGLVARVGSDVVGARVGLPDVHLVAAGALALDVALAVDEGGGVALGIAVAGAVVGAAGVELGLGSVGNHFRQVEGRVHAAGELGGVDVEGELVARQGEHLVLVLGLVEEVDARGDDSAVEDVLQAEGSAIGGHAVDRVVWDTLNNAVLSARLLVGAGGGVWRVAPVTAVVTVGSLVDRVGKRVEDDVVLLGLAAVLLGAPERGDLWVDFF